MTEYNTENNKNTVASNPNVKKNDMIDNIVQWAESMETYVKDNPQKVKSGLKTLSVIVLAGGLVWYGSRIGRGNAIEQIEHLQQSTQIEAPYRKFGPNSMVSNQPAKDHFLHMKEGQQFWYQGKIVTLVERLNDDDKGYQDIFLVGNKLVEVPTSGLNDSATIDQVFDKYGGVKK